MNKLLFIVLLFFSVLSSAELAVIVHPNNPLNSLSHKQVQRLFLGRMHMFPDSDVIVDSVDQKEESFVYQKFYQDVIRMSASKLKRYRAYYLFSGKGKLPAPTNKKSVLDHVSKIENAISYVPMDQVNDSVKVVFTHTP
jgi:ABC-type phosphate transport system substrate-binding protein